VINVGAIGYERICKGAPIHVEAVRWRGREGANVSGLVRRVSIEGSHGQITSDFSSHEGLCSKMDFVILIVRLTTLDCQDLLLLELAILLDRGVVDTTAIHTTPTGCPHLSI
jgi:hypothetical protein